MFGGYEAARAIDRQTDYLKSLEEKRRRASLTPDQREYEDVMDGLHGKVWLPYDYIGQALAQRHAYSYFEKDERRFYDSLPAEITGMLVHFDIEMYKAFSPYRGEQAIPKEAFRSFFAKHNRDNEIDMCKIRYGVSSLIRSFEYDPYKLETFRNALFVLKDLGYSGMIPSLDLLKYKIAEYEYEELQCKKTEEMRKEANREEPTSWLSKLFAKICSII
jgi:hypothetical protein